MSTEIIALDKPNYEPLGAKFLVQAIQIDPKTEVSKIIGLSGKPLIESTTPYERVFIVAIGSEIKKMSGYENIEIFDEIVLPWYHKVEEDGFDKNNNQKYKIVWNAIPQQEVYDPITKATFMIINFTDALVIRKTDSKLSKFKNQ